jgi:hypothetical protein
MLLSGLHAGINWKLLVNIEEAQEKKKKKKKNN